MSFPPQPDAQQIEIMGRLQRAVGLHQRGQLAEAEREYGEILQRVPANFDALQLLGTLKVQQAKFAEGAELIGRALEINPRSARALLNMGHALASLDRHDEAVTHFARALEVQPAYPRANHGLAMSLLRLGRFEEALANFDRVLAAEPGLPEAAAHRAVALARLGRNAEALAAFDRAAALRPNDSAILNNRGNVLRALQRYDEALRCFDAALALSPGSLDALCNRGSVLTDLDRSQEAIACFDRALTIKPDLAQADYNRGNALRRLDRIDDAIASYDRALALAPDFVDALHNRGSALEAVFRFEEAIASYERALAIRPDNPFTAGQCAFCHLALNDWDRADSLKHALDVRLDGGSGDVEPFVLVAFGERPDAQLARTRDYVRRRFAREIPVPRRSSRSGDKLRIAYMSSDFRRHPTSYLIAELFELHDRSRFEIVGVSFGRDDASPMRARILKSFDRCIDARSLGDEHVANAMIDAGVDIAVDLNGYIASNRAGILAHRPAPIQASYLGYPATMAVPFIDYIIGDRFVTPPEDARFYSERIVQLPDCYQVNDSTRRIGQRVPSRAEAGLPEEGVVFCCFNNNYKIMSATFDVWMRLLRAVDGSVLWLLAGSDAATGNLRRAARARGVDPARMVFAPRVEMDDHLARHALADLFLDTLPYNAHTTGSDALWAGMPLITCTGGTFAGRVGTSLLHAAGLPELVTGSFAEYEALARNLALDPPKLGELKARLRSNRSTHPLFDTRRFARHIEAAYAQMWNLHQSGREPESFAVDPIGRAAAGG